MKGEVEEIGLEERAIPSDGYRETVGKRKAKEPLQPQNVTHSLRRVIIVRETSYNQGRREGLFFNMNRKRAVCLVKGSKMAQPIK